MKKRTKVVYDKVLEHNRERESSRSDLEKLVLHLYQEIKELKEVRDNVR